MGRRIYEVTDAYEYSGQSVYRDTEAEAIKDSEEDIRKNDYYYIEVSDVNDRVMFKANFYKLKYEKLLRDLVGDNPPKIVREEVYEELKSNKYTKFAEELLKKIPYYIVVGKDIETRENFLN